MTKKVIDLSALDDKLLDGLRFCIKVYDLLEQIQSEPDGLGKIRLLSGKREKRLLEELLPIAHYIQARYSSGNRLKIRWKSGSQRYDAVVWTPLRMVSYGGMPRKITLEVTTSRHEKTHIARRLLHETGGSFGPKGISIDTTTGQIASTPYIFNGPELVSDLAKQIIERLKAKAEKDYPRNTVLIINCETNELIHPDEWLSAVQQVEKFGIHKSFREVFLVALKEHYSVSLWGTCK